MKEIIEVKDRHELNEGRDSGIAFGFVKQIDKNTFHTVQPLSPCKDFLNEIVFTENTGIPCKIYGLVCEKPEGIYKKNFCFLAFKILKTFNGNYDYIDSFEEDVKLLNRNYKKIQKLLNTIETLIGLPKRSVITKAENDYFLVKVPLEWIKSTVNISLYSLLLRVALTYDGKGDALEFLDRYEDEGLDIERDMVSVMYKKLLIIIERKKLVDQPPFPEPMENWWNPHEIGIINTPI